VISSFFHLKSRGLNSWGAPWQYHRGARAHALNFFECAEIRVTREIDYFRQNFRIFLQGSEPRYSYQSSTTYAPCVSPYNAIEILTLTPNNFENWGKTFLGVGAPGGRRVVVCPKLKMLSARGPPPYKIKLFLDRWRNALRHSGRLKK